MPLFRNLPAGKRSLHLVPTPPRIQTPTPTLICAHFLHQIEAHHVRTPSQGHPVPLHFDAKTQCLSAWAWPCDPDTEERITPSELESFRRTHRFRAPCCLCAFLDGTAYTESRIAIVETVTSQEDRNHSILNGEYVASCSKQRCGYFICLERFYTLNDLMLQMCNPRKTPLQPQELATIRDIDQSLCAGDGLFQLMTDVVIRGSGRRLEKVDPKNTSSVKDALMSELVNGMSEDRFWATFVQCLLCKTVTLRKNFALGHACGRRGRAGHPYTRPDTPDTPQRSIGWQEGESSPIFPSSPAPTELADDVDIFGVAEHLPTGEASGSGDAEDASPEDQHSDDISSIVTDDSFELPTLTEIFASLPRRVMLSED